MVIFKDIEYNSWADCCRKLLPNIKYTSITSYVNVSNCTWPEAIEYYLEGRNIKYNVEFNGVKYTSWKECCTKILPNTKYVNLAKRVSTKGYTWPETIQHYLDGKPKAQKIEFRGVKYSTWKECCEEIVPEVNYGTISKKAQGSSWVKSIEYYINKVSEKRIINIYLDRDLYNDLQSICRKRRVSVKNEIIRMIEKTVEKQ